MSKVDLHIHSTASDGRLSPAEVVGKSVAAGLTVIALADHDTVDSIVPALEAAKTFPRLEVIPAVEISTDVPRGDVHILGYFIDYTHPELTATLASLRSSRRERARAMIVKLKRLGIQIEWQRVQQIAGSSTIGRPHIAQAMLEKGYISSIREAFTKYISWDGPAYVTRQKITPVEAVALIIKANGLPVLGHPSYVHDLDMMITELKAAGLVGMEVYYKDYTEEERNGLGRLARKHNLIATGGSDYHGLDDSTEIMIGGANVPQESVEQLIARAEQRALKLASPSIFGVDK